jgi:hypothetical protein
MAPRKDQVGQGLGTPLWQGLSVLVGVGVIGAAGLLTSLKLWVVVLLGLASYAAMLLVLPRRKDADEVVVDGERTLEDLDGIIVAAQERIRRIEGSAPGHHAEADIRAIAQAAQDVVKEIRRDPSRLGVAHGFLTHHLPQAAELVGEYVRLDDLPKGVRDEEVLRSVRTALGTVAQGFKAQHKALIDKDVRQASLTAETLTRMLAIEHGSDIRKEGR